MKMRSLVGLIVSLTACMETGSLAPPSSGAIVLFPVEAPECRHSREQALARAAELERIADARWERVPFSREEAPTAVMEMAEAASCYQLAGERTGRLRAQGKRGAFEQEVARRFARARLNLDVATRLAQHERAQHEANEIVALLKYASDASYRDGLKRLSQQFSAAIADAKRSTP